MLRSVMVAHGTSRSVDLSAFGQGEFSVEAFLVTDHHCTASNTKGMMFAIGSLKPTGAPSLPPTPVPTIVGHAAVLAQRLAACKGAKFRSAECRRMGGKTTGNYRPKPATLPPAPAPVVRKSVATGGYCEDASECTARSPFCIGNVCSKKIKPGDSCTVHTSCPKDAPACIRGSCAPCADCKSRSPTHGRSVH